MNHNSSKVNKKSITNVEWAEYRRPELAFNINYTKQVALKNPIRKNTLGFILLQLKVS